MIGQGPIGAAPNGAWWDASRAIDSPLTQQFGGGLNCPIGSEPIGSWWDVRKPSEPTVLTQLFGGSLNCPNGSAAIGMWWNPPMQMPVPVRQVEVDVDNGAMRRRRRLLHRDDEDVLFIIQGFLICQSHGA